MEAKLQELTDKIYREGVERARREAEDIIAEARRQAEQQLAEAKREADHLRTKAEEEAEEMRRNVTSELQLSARQSVSGLRQEITNLIATRLLNEPLKEAFKDKAFLQRIIEAAINNWNANDSQAGLAVVLPEKEREGLGQYFESRTQELLSAGLAVTFDGRLSQGFRIGPGDGAYVVSFTPEDFERFFRAYLRPQADSLLYGEGKE
ncbi:MAG: hypothetical protein KDC66_03000 [Phaeodactylibacter sp.]|nr:hypothetical protein [Phaeodactylibacter sp.]MCB9276450.1 V-type ATP synthase subunit E [Lewinellaceae bacterium]